MEFSFDVRTGVGERAIIGHGGVVAKFTDSAEGEFAFALFANGVLALGGSLWDESSASYIEPFTITVDKLL